MNVVTTESNWTFELGVGDSNDFAIYVIVGFMQRDQLNQKHQNNDTLSGSRAVNSILAVKNFQMQDNFVIILLINIQKHMLKSLRVSDI